MVSPDAVTVELTAHQRSTEQFRLPTASVAVAETRVESADLDRHLANVYRAKVIERAKHKRRMAVALLLAVVSLGGLTVWGLRRHPKYEVAQSPLVASAPARIDPTIDSPDLDEIGSIPLPEIETGASITAVRPRRVERSKAANNFTGPSSPAVPVAPKVDTTALYQRALNIVSGRDVKKLKRAELLQALQYFQNVKSGPHAADANRQAERLGREFDRRTF